MRKAKSNAMLRGLASTALVLLISATAWGQKMKITGTVIDNTNEPIIGASVLENGTQNGVATDLDGHFTIEVQQGAKLKISYIGYKNKEVKASNGIKITLEEEANMLNEVVAIGYGSVKRKDVTTAVSSVSAKDLSTRPIVSAAAGMQGKAAGLQISQANGQPGASPTIRVRGTTSLNGSNDPLYVVDGVPMTNIDFLPADDIDNIQVLKDASSAAIYGSRAANGVIIIGTKQGKTGVAKISLNAHYAFNTVRDNQESLNAAQYKELMDEIGMVKLPEGLKDMTDWKDEVFNLVNIEFISFTGDPIKRKSCLKLSKSSKVSILGSFTTNGKIFSKYNFPSKIPFFPSCSITYFSSIDTTNMILQNFAVFRTSLKTSKTSSLSNLSTSSITTNTFFFKCNSSLLISFFNLSKEPSILNIFLNTKSLTMFVPSINSRT